MARAFATAWDEREDKCRLSVGYTIGLGIVTTVPDH